MPGGGVWEAYISTYFLHWPSEVHMIHNVNLPRNILIVVEITSTFLVL